MLSQQGQMRLKASQFFNDMDVVDVLLKVAAVFCVEVCQIVAAARGVVQIAVGIIRGVRRDTISAINWQPLPHTRWGGFA